MNIVTVGVLGRLISHDGYSEQLQKWVQEGFIEMSHEEATALGAQSEATLSVVVDEFADLDDGSRVITDDRDCSFRFETHGPFMTMPPGQSISEEDLAELMPPQLAMIEQWIRDAVMDWDTVEERWGPLVAALERRGISTTPFELDALPFVVEMTPELRSRLGA